MKRIELERAWPAAEPPPGFADRVLERVPSGPAPAAPVPRRESGWWRWAAPGARWRVPAAALAVSFSIAGAWWLGSSPAHEGELIAAEPRTLSLGERVRAELERGAHVRWSRDEVWQERGGATYSVEPGAPLRVQTPHGNIDVLGTVFRVVVADPSLVEGEPMKKRWAVAGASGTLGALLLVSVERGSVRVSNGERELALREGQSGAIGADGVPRVSTDEPGEARAADTTALDAERARSRKVADAVRRHAARRRQAALSASAAPKEEPPPEEQPPEAPPVEFVLPQPDPSAPPPDRTPEETRRRDYIRKTVREQYFPVARDCYDELLRRQPSASGRVVLEWDIVGDGDAGVVDRVALREDETTLHDAEFELCMRESMYTAVFEPPPAGTSETTVVYPIELRPE